MNPYDFRGPAFLLFYATLGALVIGAVYFVRRLLESGAVTKLGSVDPYLVACLRGGRREALLVATLSLVDRGLLLQINGAFLQAQPGAEGHARRPLERAILRTFRSPTVADKVFEEGETLDAARALEAELRGLRWIPDFDQLAVR